MCRICFIIHYEKPQWLVAVTYPGKSRVNTPQLFCWTYSCLDMDVLEHWYMPSALYAIRGILGLMYSSTKYDFSEMQINQDHHRLVCSMQD
jgi:hypothetical protein